MTCESHLAYPGARGPTPWTPIEVRFQEVVAGTAAEVEVVYENCEPGVDCQPQRLGSTGALEQRILDGIRARLEAGPRG